MLLTFPSKNPKSMIPMNCTNMVNTISISVYGEMSPYPTVENVVIVQYREVT